MKLSNASESSKRNSCTQCQEDLEIVTNTLKSANKTVEASKKVIKIKDLVITNQEDYIQLQNKRIEQLNKEQNSILNNKTLWLFLGMAMGGFLIKTSR